MDTLLNPVSTVRSITKRTTGTEGKSTNAVTDITSLDDAITVLQSSPSIQDITKTLRFLHFSDDGELTVKDAKASTIVVTRTIFDWWDSIKNDKDLSQIKSDLLGYLCRLICLNTIISRIKILSSSAHGSSNLNHRNSEEEELRILLDVLEQTLASDDVVTRLYKACCHSPDIARQKVNWKEVLALLSSGRLVSIVAEAEDRLTSRSNKQRSSWLSQGSTYSRWLARNIASATNALVTKEVQMPLFPALANMLGKSLSLGYQDDLVESLLERFVCGSSGQIEKLLALVVELTSYQQRAFLLATINTLYTRFLVGMDSTDVMFSSQSSKIIGDCAALIQCFVTRIDSLREFLMELCINVESSQLTRSLSLRRIALVVLCDDEERMTSMLERMLTKFGDLLFIRHATISQQEALAQSILILAGYLHRMNIMSLFTIAKSSIQTHGTSNRLKAPSQRAQWLGMVVAMNLSELTDKPGNRLVFDDDSMQTDEAKFYANLLQVRDASGNINNLNIKSTTLVAEILSQRTARSQSQTKPRAEKLNGNSDAKKALAQPVPRIVELASDDDDDNDDIVPYAKPESDLEDEDDDPTLVERNKPRAPVYIRDLLSGLRESENYDRHRLNLETAATLIRRKANFGKEVSDHAEELLAILLNLNDTFEMDDFLDLRQKALISLLIAQPQKVGPQLASSCFEGSYSLQQRAAMLTALALGARELVGLEDTSRATIDIPMKQLPEHLRHVYGDPQQSRLEASIEQLEQNMIQPMALTAADQLSGPNALKVRTFSSRMEVEKKKTKKGKMATGQYAKVVASWFFMPLIAGWWTQQQSFGNKSHGMLRHLLPLYLRTLAVLLHAAGSSSMALPQLTTELWDILLSIRVNALHEKDLRTLDSLLFCFLTLLDLNEDKERLANDHAKELVETQEWAKLVLDRYDGVASQDASEDGKVKMLAAAVVVKCHEVVERWQRLMLGSMVDF